MSTSAGESDVTANALARECDVFCRYLIGRAATPFVTGKYTAAHACDPRYHTPSSFDSFLLAIAGSSPQLVQGVDSYACVAARASLLRRKLILLIAILESCSPENGYEEQIQDTSAINVIARMGWRGLLFAGRFVLAALLLAPFHFAFSIGTVRSAKT